MDTAMDVLRLEEVSDLNAVLSRVVDDAAPVVISRAKADAVVIVSLAEWRSIQETFHLLSSPKNAARLMESIAQLNEGRGVERELIDP